MCAQYIPTIYIHIILHICTVAGYRLYIGSKAKGAIYYWIRGIAMRFIFHF